MLPGREGDSRCPSGERCVACFLAASTRSFLGRRPTALAPGWGTPKCPNILGTPGATAPPPPDIPAAEDCHLLFTRHSRLLRAARARVPRKQAAGEKAGGSAGLDVRRPPPPQRACTVPEAEEGDRALAAPASPAIGRASGWGAGGERWGGGGGRAPPAALRPETSGHRIPRIPSRGSGLCLRTRALFSISAWEEPCPFPCRGSAPPCLDFPPPPSVPGRGQPGRPRAKSFSGPLRRAPGSGWLRASSRWLGGNSGGLCSPQLFPDRLTRQLLGKRCC